MEQPVIRVANQFAAIGTWRDLFMIMVKGQADLARLPDQATAALLLADLDRCLTAFFAERSAAIGYFCIIPPGIRIADRSTTRSFERILFKPGFRYRFACIVIEETGVRGSIWRAIARMVGIYANKPNPEGFHSRIEDGVEWMHGVYSETEGERPTRRELAEAVFAFQEKARGK